MELVAELVNNQLTLCIPVALVLIGAILVFTFGFKSAEQPPFDKLSSGISDERKQAGKKRKIKEKKPSTNGHIVNVSEAKADKSPTKRSTTTENQQAAKQQVERKKNETTIKNKKPEEVKVKKVVKGKSPNEKPADFDDGSWETVPTKGDKKKKQESPAKKDKKTKKVENSVAAAEKPVKEAEIADVNNPTETEPVATVVAEKQETPIVAAADVVDAEVEIVEVKKPKNEKKVSKKEIIIENIETKVNNPENEAIIEAPPVMKQEKQADGGVAFDELGDMWTEAKAVKKSKKKSRRDN